MGTYRVSRSATIAADPALVHRLVDDLREWPSWSPWEDLDPALERTYSGPGSGVGAGRDPAGPPRKPCICCSTSSRSSRTVSQRRQ